MRATSPAGCGCSAKCRSSSLPEIYGAADMLLLVSTHEGWPNVLLESMACGTPVVVSDIPGIADIVAAPAAGRIVAGDHAG